MKLRVRLMPNESFRLILSLKLVMKERLEMEQGEGREVERDGKVWQAQEGIEGKQEVYYLPFDRVVESNPKPNAPKWVGPKYH